MAEYSSGAGGPVVAPEPPPEKVAAVAVERGLGGCVMSQRGGNPFVNFLVGIGAVVGLCAVLWIIGWLRLGFLRLLAIACIAGIVVMLIRSVMALLAGFTATYLYEGGFVHTKNGRISVVTWQELDQVLLWRAGGKTSMAGTLLCYYVVTFDGRKVPVEAKSAKGDAALGERLQQIAQQLGRPVVDSGPYTGRLRP